MKKPLRKKATQRMEIEISGNRSGPRFERELHDIISALRRKPALPFLVTGGCLRVAEIKFEPFSSARPTSGELVVKFRSAEVADIAAALRKRAIFTSIDPRSRERARRILIFHLAELLTRASRVRSHNQKWGACLRINPETREIISASPPLYFGNPIGWRRSALQKAER